jgi:hypothetical protein
MYHSCGLFPSFYNKAEKIKITTFRRLALSSSYGEKMVGGRGVINLFWWVLLIELVPTTGLGLAQSIGPNSLGLLPLYPPPFFYMMTKTEQVFETLWFWSFQLCCKTMEKVHKKNTSTNIPSSKYFSICFLVFYSFCLSLYNCLLLIL